MRLYVQDGFIPSPLKHDFILEIPNSTVSLPNKQSLWAECRTQFYHPTVQSGTCLLPTLNINYFQSHPGVRGWDQECIRPWCWLKSSVPEFCVWHTKGFLFHPVHLWLLLSEGAKHSNLCIHCHDQLPCCREHFLSVILVSGPRPTMTASKCGSLIRWCRLSCLTNQHTRVIILRDKTQENCWKHQHKSSRATPRHTYAITSCSSWGKWLHLPSLNFLTCKYDNDRTPEACED